jgi:hypothetical protein
MPMFSVFCVCGSVSQASYVCTRVNVCEKNAKCISFRRKNIQGLKMDREFSMDRIWIVLRIESGLLRYWWTTIFGMRFGQRGIGSRNIHEYDKDIYGPVMLEVIQLAHLMRYVKPSTLLSCGQIAEQAFFSTTIRKTFNTRIYSPHIIHFQKQSTISPSPHFHSFLAQLQIQSPFSSSCPSDLRIARQTS